MGASLIAKDALICTGMSELMSAQQGKIVYKRNKMKIGITYDLRQYYLSHGMGEEETAEFDRPDTIDAIDNALFSLGYETDRIGNIKNLATRLVAGDRWDMVFNIAEGISGFGREAQVPALLDAYGVPYVFSDALILALTLHKGLTKRVIRDLGIPTPDFAVIETEEDISRIALPFPLLVKPVAEGSGKGINDSSKVTTKAELSTICKILLKTFKQPILVEGYLPGREFTVGIVGTGKYAASIGVMEVILKNDAERDVYSYTNKEFCEELVEYRKANDDIAKMAEKIALAAWRGLGCRDAGRIDLRADCNGIPNFIEVNPLAGLHPEHSDLCIIGTQNGISYQSLIGSIMSSALSRISTKQKYLKGAAHG